ncbi:hypothetical protein B0H19DRAFT_391764 [Mycena capillaripes]|nr:hypothetical protein B0H19DRAFT_391764 [Mycena capillaripes]
MDSLDIPRTESSSSFFFYPPKSSLPIEIPRRQHNESVPSASECTTSPELIFEMEPFSPLDPQPTHYPLGLSTSPCTKDDHEPLLYPFPVASHINTHQRTRLAPQNAAGPSFSLPPITHRAPANAHRRSQSTLQLTSPRQAPADLDPSHAIRAVPIHKITGFKPDFAVQAPEAYPTIKRPPREKPLTPPPRSASVSSSPWRIPGRGDASSDDEPLRSLEVDPSAVDFTQYLFRRIDSQKPLQFQTFQAVMSVSVR